MASFGRRSGSESSFLIIMIIGPLSEWHIRVSEDFWTFDIFFLFFKDSKFESFAVIIAEGPGELGGRW